VGYEDEEQGLRNKIIGVVIGVTIALTTIYILAPLSLSNKHVLMPECGGAISFVEIQYSPETAVSTLPAIRAFINSIGQDVSILVVCGTQEDQSQAMKVLDQNRCRFIVLGKSITGWSKDRFLVARTRPHTLLLPRVVETGIPGRANDNEVGKLLAKTYSRSLYAVEVDLFFDAGDLLCSGEKLIVSDSLWEKNGKRPTFIDDLKRLFDNEIVWLRNVPDHHIGMFVAPLNDRCVLVGDPQLAKPYWNKALDKEYGKADFSPETMSRFKEAAEQLQKAGYKVIRVPTAPFNSKTYISYTNGVFEKGVVYMPVYGIPELDQMAQEAYRKQGMVVKPIPVKSVYKLHGTIGCLVNVLDRR
jgi:N-dimethylarginine dimethylaminohydrolase